MVCVVMYVCMYVWLSFRDILKIVWDYEGRDEEFNRFLPSNAPITVQYEMFQQFVMSRYVCTYMKTSYIHCIYVYIHTYAHL